MSSPLFPFSQNTTDYPRDTTIARLFEEVAVQYPNNIALTFGESQLTYRELNARADRLALYLRALGVGRQTLVACLLGRSLDLIVALVAILKTGAAYVPLEPSYPKERLDFLLQDTQPVAILSHRSLATTFSRGDIPFVLLDDLDLSTADDQAPSRTMGAPTDLAYVMYTSGSTGAPKGVMVPHRAVLRLVRGANYCHFGPDEVFLQLAPISFDASTFEIWGALLNGGRLVLMPPQLPSLEDIGRAIRTYGITTLWLTSGLFHLMVEQRLEDLRPVRQLLAGGDILSSRHVRTCLEKLPHTTVINGYGPTENTTFTCCHVMRPGDSVPDSVPIGRPISHTQVFILNSQLQPIDHGARGEICVSGDGLAIGYLNRPQESAEKFLPNPFDLDPTNEQPRLYRTGDLGRWLPDGSLEFLGRIDNQVKILGYRVEPQEVESVFRNCEAVQQICVVPKHSKDGSKRLIAFYIPSHKPAVAATELRALASRTLPDYMVPSQFVPLDAFPLSTNGKIDRKALATLSVPSQDTEGFTSERPTFLQSTLQEIWQSILERPHIGPKDNFFDLGGDSLLLVKLHSQLCRTLNLDLSLMDLFQFPTIESLADHLEAKQQPTRPNFSSVHQTAREQRKAFVRWRERQATETR